MKKLYFALFTLFFSCGLNAESIAKVEVGAKNIGKKVSEAVSTGLSKRSVVSLGNRKVVDKIVARVNGRNILLSDINRPRIDKSGAKYTLEEAIEHELLFQQAAKKKLLAKNIDIDKYILAWKETNQLTNISDEEFENRLKKDGLTIRSYREQLSKILAIKNLRQFEVSERVVITAREVEEFYKKNPVYSEDRYLLKVKIVAFDKAKNEEEAVLYKDATWVDLGWIDRSRLADNMKFITGMKEGEFSEAIKAEDGYQIFKLDKFDASHKKSIDESWTEIERKIQEKKIAKFEEEYVVELRKKASVIYL